MGSGSSSSAKVIQNGNKASIKAESTVFPQNGESDESIRKNQPDDNATRAKQNEGGLNIYIKKDIAETAIRQVPDLDDDDDDDDDGEDDGGGEDNSEKLSLSSDARRPSRDNEVDKLERLEKIHHNGHVDDARFKTKDYKVLHEYLAWATETGSRGDSVVIPDEGMKVQQKHLLRDTMKKLEDATSYTGTEELRCLLVLCKMSDVRQQDYVDLVTELGYAQLFMKIWNSLHKEVDVKDQITNPGAYLAVNLLLDATQGYTELGVELCRQMGVHCVPSLLTELYDSFYDVHALNQDSKKLRWMSRREFVKRILSVLYHCIRYYPDNKTIFREHHATDLLKPFLKCRFLILRVKAIFTLAYIVTEDENAHLNTTNTNIDFIVKILRKALNEPNHYSAHYNFSAIQVADAMTYLAANDNNKVQFVSAGALSLLVIMMQEGNPLKEQNSAINALWILSFHKDNKQPILEEKDCIEIVKQYKDKETLSRPCQAILWNVGETTHATLTKPTKAKAALRKATAKARLCAEGAAPSMPDDGKAVSNDSEMEVVDVEEEISTNHVMLSYQWDAQKQILKVKELLRAAGYNVWMDVDQMGGSTLEAMASAVENAAVVLICFSEKYKNSPACRTEAEYTFKLNKPIVPLKVQEDYDPDGWLGIMLGTKFYIEMCTTDMAVENIERLKRELANRGRALPSTGAGQSSLNASMQSSELAQSRGDFKRQSSRKNTICAKTASTWTNDDVNKWLTKAGLAELKNRLEGYDGQGVLGLKTIASSAPEFFYKEVKTELGLKSLREIIKFKQALDDIL